MISYSCYHNLYNNYVSITCYSILIYFSLIISQLQYKSGRNYNVNMGLESLPSCADPSIVALMKGNIYFLACGEVTSYLEGNAWILSELCSIPQCVSFLVQMSSNEIPDCTYSEGLANRPYPCDYLSPKLITKNPVTTPPILVSTAITTLASTTNSSVTTAPIPVQTTTLARTLTAITMSSQDPISTPDAIYNTSLFIGIGCGVILLSVFLIVAYAKHSRQHPIARAHNEYHSPVTPNNYNNYESNCTYCSCCNTSKSKTYYEGG